MYIVGFNGPPRSGKDTLANFLAGVIETETGIQPQILSLSMPMRRVVYALLGESYDKLHYEANKDVPQDLFNGSSIREAMIALSERHVKPLYGQDFWGRSLLQEVWTQEVAPWSRILLIPDVGFYAEVDTLVQATDVGNVVIVNVHRNGKAWGNDSRSYIVRGEDAQFRATTIHNDGPTLADAETEARRLYGRLVNQFGWKL